MKDYIVLLPQTYFEPSVLRKRVEAPCTALQRDTSTCLEFKATPLPRDAVESTQFAEQANYPAEKLPADSSAVQLASVGCIEVK